MKFKKYLIFVEVLSQAFKFINRIPYQNEIFPKSQDTNAIKSAYTKFTAYFHNPEIQQNIRTAKEEQFQEGFLRELFVKVLGYTLNPSPGFNLTTEYKNVKVIAVIELRK